MDRVLFGIKCIVLAILPLTAIGSPDSTSSIQWERWENSLTSAKVYRNPYQDVTLSVTYTGPEGQKLRTYGFWDGAALFKIRCAFPIPGVWTWQTTSSNSADNGLHQQGTVTVSPYTGTNPLYQRGFLKVAPGNRHLEFANGTPFFWSGDTAWIGPCKASQHDWETYIANRVKNKFTVIQISPASEWAAPNSDTQGNSPFFGRGIAKWNPSFWQGYEEKVQSANDRGLCVLVVGLMEPVSRYPSSSEAKCFARNLVARLYGNFVIFSASFDSPAKSVSLGNVVGEAIRDATSVHLITQHPGTDFPAAKQYHDQPYVDFSSYQSGHNNGDEAKCMEQAAQWGLDLYHRKPIKPVVNLEAFYDAHGFSESDKKYGGSAKDARALGYLSRLSGACGYTYGAYGLWNWVADEKSPAFWAKALHYPSAGEMKLQTEFFSALTWWRLAPSSNLIQNQANDPLHRMALAKTASGDLAVAYLPDDPSIQIKMDAFPSPMSAQWYDPVSGHYSSLPDKISPTGVATFLRPKKGDWVLLLQSVKDRSLSRRN